MPATGEPRTTRGTSPHASVVDSPTASSRCQMSGTSSTRIQCSWTFWRSVTSAVSRAYVVRDVGDDPQLLGAELAAVDADPHHEVLVVELVRLEDGGSAAGDAGARAGCRGPTSGNARAGRQGRCWRSHAGRRWSRSARRTLRPSSSFFVRSLGLSGSRWPRAHWPSPRRRDAGAVVAGMDLLEELEGTQRRRNVRFGATRAGASARPADVGRWARSGRPTHHAAHPPVVHVAARHEEQRDGRRHAGNGATSTRHARSRRPRSGQQSQHATTAGVAYADIDVPKVWHCAPRS